MFWSLVVMKSSGKHFCPVPSCLFLTSKILDKQNYSFMFTELSANWKLICSHAPLPGLSVPTCSSHSYLATFLLESADTPLSATEPLSLLSPIGHCCITIIIIILNGLIHFPLQAVDVQHNVSFPFKSHDERSQKSSLYCGFSTPVLPSASAQSSLAATGEMNADWGRGWVPTCQMEMVSNNSPESIFWEYAVVCTVVRLLQPVSGIVHYHTESCYWLLCTNGNFFSSIYLRVHPASSCSEDQWKRKQEVLLGSGQQSWSLSITKCIWVRVFPQA